MLASFQLIGEVNSQYFLFEEGINLLLHVLKAQIRNYLLSIWEVLKGWFDTICGNSF